MGELKNKSVCEDCPLAKAVYKQCAEAELFSATTEFSSYEDHPTRLGAIEGGLGDIITPNVIQGIMKNVGNSLNHDASRNMEIIGQLSEYVIKHGCPGKVDTLDTDNVYFPEFCAVEGKLREQGIIVPEY